MIQRKQSLFLLLAVVAYALCLFLPIAGVTPAGMGAESLVYNLGMVDTRDFSSWKYACHCSSSWLFLQ